MDERTIVFVTTELAPVVPGGAGTVVHHIAERLARAGRRVIVVLVTGSRPGPSPSELYEVRPVVVPPGRDRARAFLDRSRAAAEEVARLVQLHRIERIEFQDFDGLAFWTLTHRDGTGTTRSPITVRMHGPIDLMAEAIGRSHDEWETSIAMERASFEMADAVLVPSDELGSVLVDRYDVPSSRVLVGHPPIPDVGRVERRMSEDPEFVAVGRLAEVKGSHDLVEASLRLLASQPRATVRFVGPDGWSITAGSSMRTWLSSRVPARFQDRIRFEEAVPRVRLPEVLAGAWAVVVPSRFESFCLVAHEMRRAGLPVVVPELPAFRAFFGQETGALVYDGSVPGLAASLRRLAEDRDYAEELGRRPAPTLPGGPVDPYESDVSPHHPRTQAGLATDAIKRLEAMLEEPSPPTDDLVQRGLRLIPASLARAASAILPGPVKRRVHQRVDWWAERERRNVESWRDTVRTRIASGEFDELGSPDVSVVIPCFNQGGFLEDAILSVFAQEHTSFEIIVVDDGSTDPGTRRTLARLSFPRTQIMRQENRGLPRARNAAIENSRGRFIVPLDADDQIAPGFLSTLVAELEASPDAGFAHCWAELFGEVSAIWTSRPYNPYQQLLSNGVVGCVVARREALLGVGGYDGSMTNGNEDWDLWLRMQEAGWGQVQVREPLFRYRKHGRSMSVATEARFEQARLDIARRHHRLYEPRRVRRLKREHYPWVSTLVASGSDIKGLLAQDLDDVEVIPLEGIPGLARAAAERGWRVQEEAADLAGAVRAARGKLLADWTGVETPSPSALRRLAEPLELYTNSRGTVPSDWPQPGRPLVWRRWSLLDRAGPADDAVRVDVEMSSSREGATEFTHGGFPSPGWDLDLDLAGTELPVRRQEPEEEGPLPDWLVAAGNP